MKADNNTTLKNTFKQKMVKIRQIELANSSTREILLSDLYLSELDTSKIQSSKPNSDGTCLNSRILEAKARKSLSSRPARWTKTVSEHPFFLLSCCFS